MEALAFSDFHDTAENYGEMGAFDGIVIEHDMESPYTNLTIDQTFHLSSYGLNYEMDVNWAPKQPLDWLHVNSCVDSSLEGSADVLVVGFPFNERWSTLFGVSSTLEPHESSGGVQVQWEGQDSQFGAKWINGSSFHFAYSQSITSTLTLGFESFYDYLAAEAHYAGGLHYERGATELAASFQSNGECCLSYYQRISPWAHAATVLNVEEIEDYGIYAESSVGFSMEIGGVFLAIGLRSGGIVTLMTPIFDSFFLCEADLLHGEYVVGMGAQF